MRLFWIVVLMLFAAPASAQQRYVIVDPSGNVINAIIADPSYAVPAGFTALQSDVAGPGWTWSQAAGFVAPPLTPAAGFQIVSSSTPALNGIYPIDMASQLKVQAISLYVAVNAKFPAGQNVQLWPDVNGAMHQFQTTAQWQAFATAMGDFVAADDLGQTPAQPVTIP